MKDLIGNRLINSLAPCEKTYEVKDSRLPGFFLRVYPSGKVAYYCQYARGKKIKIGDVAELKPASARDIAKKHLEQARSGKDPVAERKKATAGTLENYIINKYGPWVENNRKDGKATVARIRSCFAHLFKTKITEINAWQVEKWRASRLKSGIKTATVNRDLTALKAALSKAVEWGIIEFHPLDKVKPAHVDSGKRVRFLDHEEENRLRTALTKRSERMRQERDSANEWRKLRGYRPFPSLRIAAYVDHLEPMVLISLNTALRRGELFNLTWKNIDFTLAILTVDGANAKSGSTRHIPLNVEALGVLRKWQEQTTGKDLVFPGKDGKPLNNIKKAWSKLLSDAKISAFRWHDLRHHFASRLVMAGVDLNTVRELLGHSDIKMTLRYAHLAPEHKAAAVAKLVEYSE